MTIHERWLRRLHAYHDAELGGFGRRRVEAKLRKSPELRRELEALRSFGELLQQADAGSQTDASTEIWTAIHSELRRIDAELSSSRQVSSLRSLFGRLRGYFGTHPGWGPLGSVAAVAAVLLVSLQLLDIELLSTRDPVPSEASEERGGTLRYLKTDGRSFVVSEGRNGVTIIWLMDFPVGT